MKKFLQKHIMLIHCLILIIVGLLEVLLITRNQYIFGTDGDWLKQSVGFRHYFRSLFYETKDLFPDLALHIGGGQNIYYFAYYGLFSPSLLLSYLFPFVKMGDFIIITGIINIISSSILLYIFLIKSNYNENESLIGALLLLTNTALVSQNANQIMFIQYMPFLILGLIGTKKYLDEHKSFLLIISIVLIILTSYYFSIPSIICLSLYALHYYMKNNDKSDFKTLLKEGMKYISRIVLGIMIAGFLLFPVIYTILNGRVTNSSIIKILDFIPGIYINYLMYSRDGMGFTAIVYIALIYNILYLKKSNKLLSIALFLLLWLPIFNLILNGFLYTNGKVFIPFIPLLIILIMNMIYDIKHVERKKIITTCFLTVLSGIFILKYQLDFKIFVCLCDVLFTCIALYLYNKTKKIKYIFPIICYTFMMTIIIVVRHDHLLTKNDYISFSNRMHNEMSSYINNNTDSIYRYEDNLDAALLNFSNASYQYITSVYSSTLKAQYKTLFYDTFNNNFKNSNIMTMFQQKNLFFEKFMGIRYFFTKNDAPYGYEKVKEYENGILYENKNVYSIGFTSTHLLNYDEYKKLPFIEKLEAYQNNIIVDSKSSNSDLNFNYEKISLDYKIKEFSNISWAKENNHYLINSDDDGEIVLTLNDELKNDSLVIRLYINNQSKCTHEYKKYGHLGITINGVHNVLTCIDNEYYNNNKIFDYVMSSNDIIDEFKIKFYKGYYDISDIEIYSIDNSFFDNNNTSSIAIDFDETKGDRIKGTIDIDESGYFIFTIPYDEGYTILVDGEKIDIEKVNEEFIGFKINKGYHTIELNYSAPYSKTGKIISIIGIIIFILLIKFEGKKLKN